MICLTAEFGRFKRFQMFNGLADMFGFGRFGTCLPAGVWKVWDLPVGRGLMGLRGLEGLVV